MHLNSRRTIFRLLYITLSLLIAGESMAGVVRVKENGSARVDGDREECYLQAFDQARHNALVRVLKRKYKNDSSAIDRASSLLSEDPDQFIKGAKELKRTVSGGECRVTARFRIKQNRLLMLVKEEVGGHLKKIVEGRRLWTAIRFLVDGESVAVSSDKKLHILIARAHKALRSKLQEHGAEIIVLDKESGVKREYLTGVDVMTSTLDSRLTYKMDSLEAEEHLISVVRDMIKRRPSERGINWVVVGEVSVSRLGRDPQGPGYLTEASSTLTLIDMNNKQELASKNDIRIVDARTESMGIEKSMMFSVDYMVDQVANIIVNNTDPVSSFRLKVYNMKSEFRQLEPIREILDRINIKIITEKISKEDEVASLDVTYLGEYVNLKRQISKELRRMISVGEIMVDDVAGDDDQKQIHIVLSP